MEGKGTSEGLTIVSTVAWNFLEEGGSCLGPSPG